MDWKILKKKKKKKMVDVVLLWAGPTCQGTFCHLKRMSSKRDKASILKVTQQSSLMINVVM